MADQLATKYASQLQQLSAIFPDWDEQDLLFTLQDVKGNLEEAAVMITEGRAQQFTTANSKKKAPKPKDKALSSRNVDNGGWGDAGSFDSGFDNKSTRGGRGARGGRGGSRGGRGGRGGEPSRGGRGGRGGSRAGRGGFSGSNEAWGASTSNDAIKGWGESATTTEGWGESTSAAPATTQEDGGWGAEPGQPSMDAPKESNADDFSGSGGWGDAPAPKEVEKAVKQGGNAWQPEIEKPVPVAQPSAPVVKPKLTWAQIAKPAEKPKPVPAPAPAAEPPLATDDNAGGWGDEPGQTTSDEPVAQESSEVPAEALEETAPEAVESFGDAPAQEEVEVEAEAIVELTETPAEPEQTRELLPEETAPQSAEQDSWETDPAIAGSGIEQAAGTAPEPPTTYQGPPGFSSVAAKAAPGVQTGPRSNSRAAQRYKEAEGQGVVLPASVGGLTGVEMQFGSLSFGGLQGDGVDSPVPEPKQKSPVQAVPAPSQPQAQAQASPIAPTQPPVTGLSQPPSSTPSQPPVSAPPYQQQPAQQPAFSSPAPHQTLQQQMHAYQYLQQQQAPAQSQTPEHGLQQPQNQFYRGHDFYSPIGTQGEQPQGQQPQQQAQQQQAQIGQVNQQPTNSPYEPFGAFGQQSRFLGQQTQGNQQAHAADPYVAAQRSYDSYNASGYPRPPVEEPKPATTPSHPTAAGQLPHQQSGFYSGMGNMGYYQQGPYNPYYQYGQAPQAGFQQYYPRNLYGQPAPQAAPAPIPAAKPQPTQSPYGAPPSYPAFNNEESFGSLGRYDSKPAQPAGQPPAQGQSAIGGSYGSQGLHGFLGMNNAQAGSARPQAPNASEDFKVASSGSNSTASNANATAASGTAGTSGAGVAQAQRASNQPTAIQAQQQGQQGQQQQGFGSYPYGGGYGGQDWGQYGGHYGSRTYSHWQQ
ncbi:Hypothetical protein CGB_N3110W [Cryptococcus gattii WM276]|uniref:RNA polymerase II degradation factor 1 n=2 Tax=Cryptococcus gattii TaxID=37769 RepID=E6RGA0_CRYGW|nr:Hypothetical protein CGB_N3110W [Cryptococcus gattii WM276]ADV25808.1 Hypothetical protein CGB_N3110W [Cryptococcus gattii WM276]KIR78099.1 hypothetical protein I306_04977 [Cryptococcus gattii EJB2]KJE01572.1 hypothetical protein I311_04859 [Cryptococcus gattii NT-10]